MTRGSLWRDLAGGALATLLPGLAFLRSVRGHYHRVVVIGDTLGVFACAAAGLRNVVYVDVYKTGFGRVYAYPETTAIRWTTDVVFSRSDRLASQLRACGVDARAAGNIMLDTIPAAAYDISVRRRRGLAVTLLPGSRATVAAMLALQVEALRILPEPVMPDVFVAVAAGVTVDQAAQATGLRASEPNSQETNDLGELSGGRLRIHLVRGSAMGALLAGSDLVLSQAGTATVQALGLGRPVVSVAVPGARRSRFLAEQALFGEARVVTAPDATALGHAVKRLLDDHAERERLGAIGRARVGPPGALPAILAELSA